MALFSYYGCGVDAGSREVAAGENECGRVVPLIMIHDDDAMRW